MPINYRHYPPTWRTVTRPRILARAGYQCEHCQIPNYAVVSAAQRTILDTPDNYRSARMIAAAQPVRAVVIVLTVAHLDHDEWNATVTDDRLAALCQRCHFRHDRADNDQRRKYGKRYKQHQITIL